MNLKRADMKVLLSSTLKICIGLFFTGIGTAMMYLVNWGSAPAATIGDGVHAAFHLSYGVAGIAVNIFFLVVLFFLDRKLISIGTILATFFMGIFIDLGLFIIQPFYVDSIAVPMKGIVLLLGGIITAIGLGYYVGVNFGIGAIDGMSVALNKKFGIPFTVCRWGVDIIITIVGVGLGGAWGIGTVVSVIITGPIMQVVINHMHKNVVETAGE
jgi:hypothetical protein